MADEVAAAGYIAIAPDLLSGTGPNGGGTSDFPGTDVMAGIQRLPPDQVTGDLNAAADYVNRCPPPTANWRWPVFAGAAGNLSLACNRPI